MAFAQARADREVCRAWRRLVAEYRHARSLHQSLEWFDHVRATDPRRRLFAAVLRDDLGRPEAVVPLMEDPQSLAYDVRGRVLGRHRLRTVCLPGSLPPMPPDLGLYDRLFAALAAGFPRHDAVSLTSVPTDHPLYLYLDESPRFRSPDFGVRSMWPGSGVVPGGRGGALGAPDVGQFRGSEGPAPATQRFGGGGTAMRPFFLLYEPEGVRRSHLLRLPERFADYLARFRSKKRYNLQRQVRLLRGHFAGGLRLERVTRPDEVPAFLAAAREVETESWQGRVSGPRLDRSPGKLADAAARGLLRSYLLLGGGRPVAFVVGFQFAAAYDYYKIGYREELARLSPGTCLLYLLIEDLVGHRRPEVLNFDWGDAPYKAEFGNVHGRDAGVLLLRPTAGNRWRCLTHAAFRGAVRFLRDRLAPSPNESPPGPVG
jgi:hypothetical protein